MSENLIGRPVELTDPDGRQYCFAVRAILPYEMNTYAVLEEELDNGQLLITQVSEGEAGEPVFAVEQDEDVVTAVLENYVAQRLKHALWDYGEHAEQDECGADCHCHRDGGCTDGCSDGCTHDTGCTCGHDEDSI